jgi:hypothetical protein
MLTPAMLRRLFIAVAVLVVSMLFAAEGFAMANTSAVAHSRPNISMANGWILGWSSGAPGSSSRLSALRSKASADLFEAKIGLQKAGDRLPKKLWQPLIHFVTDSIAAELRLSQRHAEIMTVVDVHVERERHYEGVYDEPNTHALNANPWM